MKNSNADYIKARKLASELLLQQDFNTFPIDCNNIKLPKIKLVITDFDTYASATNTSVSELTCNGKYNDAYVVRIDDIFLILYNINIKVEGRILWSLAHEFAHLYLKHTSHEEKHEIEADTFASQLLLPQCILKSLIQYGVPVDVAYIENTFGLSNAAAESCLRLVKNKLNAEHPLEYDDIILQKFDEFISNEISKYMTKHNAYEDEEEMDAIRNDWLY